MFDIEPLTSTGHTLDQFPDGWPASELFDRLSAAVTRPALASFEILGGP